MLFNSVQFALFFAVVFAGHRLAPPARRNAWLMLCSLAFYSAWIPAYLLLLLADLGVGQVAAPTGHR